MTGGRSAQRKTSKWIRKEIPDRSQRRAVRQGLIVKKRQVHAYKGKRL
jgi:hypothetical protein